MSEKETLTIIAQGFKVPASKIKPDTAFTKELEADSLKMLELVADIEKHYDIKINNEDLYNIKKVGDLVSLVEIYCTKKK